MAKLLIDFIETVDNISNKIIKGKNGYYLPKITSDQLNFERQLQGFPGDASPDSRLSIAIKNSQTHLLGEQEKEGFWAGVLEGDVALTAEYLMLMHFLKRIDTKKQEKATKYIIKKQDEDGGWSIYHDGFSDVSISVKCYFALKLAGHSDDEPYMQKARSCILKLGGIMKCNTFTKIYLAIFGQFDWRGIPALPVEIILLPKFFYFNIYEMSYWSRCIVVPLGIIMAKRPSSLIGDKAVLDNLYVTPKQKVSYRLKRDQNRLTIKNMFINFDTLLRRYENQPVRSIRKMAIEKSEKWMLERLEKSGGLGAIWPSMVNSLMAMKCLGYKDGNPIVEKAIEDIE
ncbi:MAG: squalene--hopene cyclase, partial [Candidatus Scalindua sp.]|nr:squalene--hopene cyclase [Candidatus Scalindua sp.]